VSTWLASKSFIKICGVTNALDAQEVIKSGADALGMIFADSPRAISTSRATQVSEVTKGHLTRVAVFRDRDDAEILAILEQVGVDAVQLHDAMSAELEKQLRARRLGIIKALAITGEEFAHFDERRVDLVLIDGERAGSGEAHSWARLEERSFRVPFVAAGGLTPENVANVINALHPWGVDCATGVETRPGEKDATRVSIFVANARRAFDEKRE